MGFVVPVSALLYLFHISHNKKVFFLPAPPIIKNLKTKKRNHLTGSTDIHFCPSSVHSFSTYFKNISDSMSLPRFKSSNGFSWYLE